MKASGKYRQSFKGYLFITEGAEHGPTLMIRSYHKGWDQARYEKLDRESYCTNRFDMTFGRSTLKDCEPFALPVVELIGEDIEPGKKYRLTIESIE